HLALSFVSRDHLLIPKVIGLNVSAQHKAALALLALLDRLGIRAHLGLHLPCARLDGCLDARAPFARIAFMLDQLRAGYVVIAPRLGQGGQSGLSALLALKAPCLQVKELLVDRFKLVFLSLAYAFFSPLRRGFRADHEPALG